MNVYITNVAKFDISIKEKTLKPGKGDVFSEEASKKDGVVAFARKGWLKIEMIKESPGGVGVAVKSKPAAVVEKKAEADPAPALTDITAVEGGDQKLEVDGLVLDSGRAHRNKKN